MKRGWQAATIALLLIFAFFAYESFQLSLRDALGPGPGFFPFWLGLLAVVLALVLLTQLHLGREGVGEGTLALAAAQVALNPDAARRFSSTRSNGRLRSRSRGLAT